MKDISISRTTFALFLDVLCLLESGVDLVVDGVEPSLRLLEALLEGIDARLHLLEHFQKLNEHERKSVKCLFGFASFSKMLPALIALLGPPTAAGLDQKSADIDF